MAAPNSPAGSGICRDFAGFLPLNCGIFRQVPNSAAARHVSRRLALEAMFEQILAAITRARCARSTSLPTYGHYRLEVVDASPFAPCEHSVGVVRFAPSSQPFELPRDRPEICRSRHASTCRPEGPGLGPCRPSQFLKWTSGLGASGRYSWSRCESAWNIDPS